jgi:signal peptidase I
MRDPSCHRPECSDPPVPERLFYRGPSMYPTLRDRDVLQGHPCECAAPVRGDVIVYPGGESQGLVAHRVIEQVANGYRCIGDNNANADSVSVQPDRVLGRVVAVHRLGKIVPVSGGPLGRVIGCAMRLRGRIDRAMSRVVGPAYRSIARSGLPQCILGRWFPVRVVRFSRDGAEELRLFLGGRWIGGLTPGASRWWIRRPYRLFVDEKSLPQRVPNPRDASE